VLSNRRGLIATDGGPSGPEVTGITKLRID